MAVSKRVSSLIALGAIGLAAASAPACPKCRLGAAALTSEPTTAAPEAGAVSDFADPRGPLYPLQISGGINFTTAYFHRGYLQEDQGLIAQPYLTLAIEAWKHDDVKLTPYVSWWNSLHDEHTFADDNDDLWYESELITGAVLSRGPLALDVKYTLFTYPNGALSQIEEIGAKLSYDFASLWRQPGAKADFVLLTWIAVDKEMSDRNEPPITATPAASSGVTVSHAPIFHQPEPVANGSEPEAGFDTSTQGTYIELGVEPSFKTRIAKTDLGFSFPVTVGLGAGDYYQESGGDNDPLGYVQAGVQATVPLAIPGSGKWYLSTSLSYLHLFADSAKFANYGHDDALIATLGVSFSY